MLLEGKKDDYFPEQIAILSASRNQAALRTHSLLRLLVEFHLPRLFNHLMTPGGIHIAMILRMKWTSSLYGLI